MLSTLHISNFALIEEIEIDFGQGFNVITGETGAGKSILVDAVDFVLGGRSSVDYIRTGTEKALVEAVFDIDGRIEILQTLEELSVQVEDGELFLTRELNRAGKNQCRINGLKVPLSLYREAGSLLADIHGQHEQQSLLKQDKHLDLLDGFDPTLIKERNEIALVYYEIQKDQQDVEELLRQKRMMLQQRDICEFQKKEIEEASLVMGEDELLQKERLRLQNAEKIMMLSAEAYDSVYAGERGSSALEKIDRTLSNLRELNCLGAGQEDLQQQLENIYYQLEDVAREIGRSRKSMDFEHGGLEEVELRLETINRLKKKYGHTIEEIIVYGKQVAASLDDIMDTEEALAAKQQKVALLNVKYKEKAVNIRTKRKAVAATIETQMDAELNSLGMPHAIFKVIFAEKVEPGLWGEDSVSFHISTNPGELLKPLTKIASGGEVSRIMLALRTILAKSDSIGTLIFDEIDAGVGGKAAQAVAERLARLGQMKQVFCVTHSPILASYGHRHYFIDKKTTGERTKTNLSLLGEEERIEEIGRILGGKNITEVTRQQAKQMILLARAI